MWAVASTKTQMLQGQVSFISSQNVYVKFDNTQGILIGDTLYTQQNEIQKAALVVKNKSSISCVTSPLRGINLTVSAPVFAIVHIEAPSIEVVSQKSKEAIAVNDIAIAQAKNDATKKNKKTDFAGKIAISSYTNIATNSNSYQRFRYNVSMDATHLAQTNLSAETYISVTHKLGEWNGLKDALRIYSLAAKYDISEKTSISLGRKINTNMANIGAVDGLQLEINNKNFSYGALVGSRPDTYTYGFNPDLLQTGIFASHHVHSEDVYAQTSVALFNQLNQLHTDRRFAYIQHSNSLVKNIDLFCSFELDLYALVNNVPTTKLNLTSSYISLRYKPSQKLSLSMNYDARKNIYYFETFKNIPDSIFDKETRQGLRFQTLYRPFTKLSWGTNIGYRFATTQSKASMNGHTYVNYTELPWLGASATVDFTYLRTTYVNGLIYGGSLSKELFNSKIYADLAYRYVDYRFTNLADPLKQNIAELSLSWRIAKKLMLSADFESTFESDGNLSGRMFLNLTKRF